MQYIRVASWPWWRWMLSSNWGESRAGLFRNLPHVKPGRWGFYVLGLEIGSRAPGDPVGLWLRQRGLWPW